MEAHVAALRRQAVVKLLDLLEIRRVGTCRRKVEPSRSNTSRTSGSDSPAEANITPAVTIDRPEPIGHQQQAAARTNFTIARHQVRPP
jgi:hypothetical protein